MQSERHVEFFNVKPCGFIKKPLGFKRLIKTDKNHDETEKTFSI